MARPPSSRRFGWADVLLTTGFAAAITAIGAYITETGRGGRDAAAHRCDGANAYLQDETPNPYLVAAGRRRLVQAAAARFLRCMDE